MPLYEYYCPKCYHKIEVIHKVAESLNVQCDKCSKAKMQKHISLTSFRLKGGGWYKDGYADTKADTKKENTSQKKEVAKNPDKKENTSQKKEEKKISTSIAKNSTK